MRETDSGLKVFTIQEARVAFGRVCDAAKEDGRALIEHGGKIAAVVQSSPGPFVPFFTEPLAPIHRDIDAAIRRAVVTPIHFGNAKRGTEFGVLRAPDSTEAGLAAEAQHEQRDTNGA